MRTLVCIPMFNEEPVAADVLREVLKLTERVGNMDILIVDDGSSDRSRSILNANSSERIKITYHNNNKGIGDVILTGIDFASRGGYSHFCLWPGNLRILHNSVARLLLDTANDEKAYYHGSRFINRQKCNNTPLLRKIPNILFSKIVSRLYGIRLSDITCGLRLFPMHLVDEKLKRQLMRSNYGGEQILTLAAIEKDLNIVEHDTILEYSNLRNYSHLNFKGMFEIVAPWIFDQTNSIVGIATNKQINQGLG